MPGNRRRFPIGMVRLGMIAPLACVPRYFGSTTATSWPRVTKALGSASTTSARPPVFEKGRPSDAANRILIISVAILVRSYAHRFCKQPVQISGSQGRFKFSADSLAPKIRKERKAGMARQRLGEHFLNDAGWREKIARAIRVSCHFDERRTIDEKPYCWIEIGAGHGEMTEFLAATGAPIYAVELDP